MVQYLYNYFQSSEFPNRMILAFYLGKILFLTRKRDTMILTINRAILHILDFNSDVTVFSQTELDSENASVQTFLTKHIEKSFNDANLKSGTFLENSGFHRDLLEYIHERLDFISFSQNIAQITHDTIAKSDRLESVDFILVDFILDDQHMLGLLFCTNRMGFTHQVIQEEDKIRNDIIHHYAILPSTSQKLDKYAFIDLNTFQLKFFDKKCLINGEDSYILPEYILQCSFGASPKETVKLMNTITQKVADNFGQDSVMAVSKAKNYLVESTEASDALDPSELGKKVFPNSEAMQEEFRNEVKSAGLPEKVEMDRKVAVKLGKNHKIKTDTGIELTIPIDYFQNKDYIEFINNPDGTLSIEVKNIGKIINKS